MSEPPPVLSYADPLQTAVHGNRVLMERYADGGVHFLIPARGLLHEMGSVVILCLVLAVSVILVGIAQILPCGVVVIFSAVMLIAMIRSATTSATLEVRNETVTQFSPVSLINPKKSWPAAEVKRLRVGWRGVSLRGRAVADLDMVLQNGRTVQLFVGRDKRELEWIAAGLAEALGLPANFK